MAANNASLAARKLHIRLHTRTIVRDGTHAFVGSQSLRALELDQRREVGVIIRNPAVVERIARTFREDWERSDLEVTKPVDAEVLRNEAIAPADKVARRVAKDVASDIGPIGLMVESTVRDLAGPASAIGLNGEKIEATVKDAVKDAVLGRLKRARPGLLDTLLNLGPVRNFLGSRMRAEAEKAAPHEHYPAPYALIDLW